MAKKLFTGTIYFVASPDLPFFPGRGGTEAFVFSHIRELQRRGIKAGLVTVALKEKDGRDLVPDIPFIDVAKEQDLNHLDATLVSVCKPLTVATQKPAYCMVHVPPRSSAYPLARFKEALKKHTLIANSKFTRQEWAKVLGADPQSIPVVYPFADPAFAAADRRTRTSGPGRVLFAGRLHISKGIYLLLEALHHPILKQGYHFTVTTGGVQNEDTQVITQLLKQHPRITTTRARTSPEAMAALMAEHDIVVLPSNHHFWQEAFGMISVEAQHAGCQVVASGSGGLPETNVGGLYLFEPGNSLALAQAIAAAKNAGPLSKAGRAKAARQFTLAQSVDSLLVTIKNH